MRPYKVYAIKHGTVIDHIDSGNALKVVKILKLDEYDQIVTVGIGLESKKMGKKDIVKIENKSLTKTELNKIALIAPHATINIIQEFKVAQKFEVALPQFMENLIKCPNPQCISRNEDIYSKFYKHSLNPLKVRCHYCERVFDSFSLI
ncbi:aspartate carbamoyltransferase regulatory subunit [Candidatus Woesearchaeota archaeon]|nr:aspartate carbamoyltransferase regulatory subunit [Candidatus Woesearchaeota archaeon]